MKPKFIKLRSLEIRDGRRSPNDFVNLNDIKGFVGYSGQDPVTGSPYYSWRFHTSYTESWMSSPNFPSKEEARAWLEERFGDYINLGDIE